MDTARPNAKIQLLCLWAGPVGIGLWLVGFVLAGLITPISPSLSPIEVAQYYEHNLAGIRFGLVLTMIGSTMTAPMVAAIAMQMKRVEGFYAPLSYTQLGLGMGGILLFIIPTMNMQAAAFRPERSVELIQLANDLGWIPFVGAWTMASLQSLAMALCVFQDKESRVFPRWFGFFNVWIAFLYCPGSLLYFFQKGPFAWDGLLSWWLVVAVFCFWFVVTLIVVRKAILSHSAEPESA